jgi:REP element-mobilizing transposase RayT
MPQSLSNVLIHTIFSTKNRAPLFKDLTLRIETHSFLAGTAKSLDCFPVAIGGVEDHVHLLTTLSRTQTIADFVKETKRVTTRWLRQQKQIDDFQWQAGYACFSVSESNKEAVIHYITNQEKHHKKMTFQEEYRKICEKYRVNLDEKFVWD